MKRLPVEFKRRWVKALRSGDYEQAKDALRTENNTYCCLGVAGDLLVQDGVCSWVKDSINFRLVGPVYGTGSLNFSAAAIDFEDVFEQNINNKFGMTVQDVLINANDSGSSFEQIADWIEENL